MDINKNYYQILNVDKTADDQEIKKAYRTLTKKYHPDKSGDEEMFKKINEANEILSDPDKRARYDSGSQHGQNYRGGFGGGGAGGFSDFFRSYKKPQSQYEQFTSDFGWDIEDFLRKGGFGGRGESTYMENLDIEITIEVSLKEIYNNMDKDVVYNRYVPCDTCHGSGEVPIDGYVSCHHCNGTGKNKTYNIDVSCINCNGTGKITKKVCPSCNASKLKLKKEKVTVNTFILNDSAKKLVYPNQGSFSKFNKGTVGKLILNLVPVPDGKYKKAGRDLYFKTKIDFKTAVLGGTIEYTHLDGKVYSVKIPDKTNNNARFKMREKGMLINTSGNRGDLYIDMEIYIDYYKLTDTDYELIKNLS